MSEQAFDDKILLNELTRNELGDLMFNGDYLFPKVVDTVILRSDEFSAFHFTHLWGKETLKQIFTVEMPYFFKHEIADWFVDLITAPWTHKKWGLRELVWQLMWRFQKKHQYNVLHTDLKPGYYDPCVQIPLALCVSVHRFVAETRNTINWSSDPGHVKAWKAFCALDEVYVKALENEKKWGISRIDALTQVDVYLPTSRTLVDNENIVRINKLLCDVVKNVHYMWYP